MSFHFFIVPITYPEAAQAELNAFLARERVLNVQRQFVAEGVNSFWAFCVELGAGPGPLPQGLKAHPARTAGREKAAAAIDYKQVLSEADFTVFAGLRELRKQLAQQEGVPVYAVFTNEQLAEVAQRRCSTKAALGEIDGIGAARIEKYGQALLGWLQTHGGGVSGGPVA